MSEIPFATANSSDAYRMTTYCPFCGRRWDQPLQRGQCIRIAGPDPADIHDTRYRYYRRGGCYERQIERLQDDVRRAEDRTRAALDKMANFRKAFADLNV